MYKYLIFFQIWNTVLSSSSIDYHHQNTVITNVPYYFSTEKKNGW